MRLAESQVTDEAAWTVADLIRKYKPTVLPTHWRGSFHQDHINCHDIVQRALSRAGLPTFRRQNPAHYPKQVLYAENWENMDGYSPDIYLDVTDIFRDYLKLLKTHARKLCKLSLL